MAASITPADETLNHLHRLSQKPGVQSTLILDRKDGAIVRASGLLVSDTPADALDGVGEGANGTKDATLSATRTEGQREDEGQSTKLRSAEDVARAVWKFFGAAREMVDDLRGEDEDEVKLLRMRMRRCEVMVVPDANFLLVVVHDTPLA